MDDHTQESSPQGESEQQLVERAQTALNACRWVVGECAARWTQRYARGRTDADFGALINLSADQVYQRRRVWETFSDVRGQYRALKWSHFYAGLTWEDTAECLQWAQESGATVAEMKAWRRAMHGEDLSQRAEEASVTFLSGETSTVLEPGAVAGAPAAPGSGNAGAEGGAQRTALSGVPRERSQQGEYAPFREGAMTPPPKDDGGVTTVAAPSQPSVAQVVKRMTNTIERCHRAITPEFSEEFRSLPEQVQSRLVEAVSELHARVAEMA